MVLRPAIIYAQSAPPIQWQKCLGGDSTDASTCIIQSSDGGYVVAGSTASVNGDVSGSHGDFDGWVVKLTPSGNIQWQKCIGGSGREDFRGIAQTLDGGYVAAGTTTSNDGDVSGNHGSFDILAVKVNSSGTIVWQRCLGGTGFEQTFSVIGTTDGGCAIVGQTTSTDGDVHGGDGSNDAWVVKLDAQGAILWQKCMTNLFEAVSLSQTSDGGYAVVGTTISAQPGFHGGGDIVVTKLNSVGSIDWQKCLGGSKEEDGKSITQTSDGGYIVVGATASNDGDVFGNHGQDDIWIVKLSSLGNIEWQKCIGGTGTDAPGYSIKELADGGFVLVGSTFSNDGDVTGNHGGDDVWVLKLDPTGSLVWQKCVGGSGLDWGYYITPTSDNGYALVGITNSSDGDVSGNHGSMDIWVVKLKDSCPNISITLPNLRLQAFAKDTIRIPLLSLDSSSFDVSVLDFSLHLNTDLLTPLEINADSGFFKGAIVDRFTVFHDSVLVRLHLTTPKHLVPGTLCVINCVVFVADTLSTPIKLQHAHLDESFIGAPCLSIQSLADNIVSFALIPECGDPTLSQFLKGDNIFSIASITPNPTSSDISIQLRIPICYQNDGKLEVYDALGNLEEKEALQFGEYYPSQNISLSLKESGVHYIRLTSSSGVSTKMVVVEK